MDKREYSRQEKLIENLRHSTGLTEINEQEICGSHPSAYLWQDAYRESMGSINKELKSSTSALKTVGNYLNEQRVDSGVQAMLGVGGAAFAITAVAVESPVLIGAATLGAVGCGGAFVWSHANSAMKHFSGKDLNGH